MATRQNILRSVRDAWNSRTGKETRAWLKIYSLTVLPGSFCVGMTGATSDPENRWKTGAKYAAASYVAPVFFAAIMPVIIGRAVASSIRDIFSKGES